MSSIEDIPPRAATQLYVITPPQLDDEASFVTSLKAVLATGKVAALQLRFKLANNTAIDIPTTRRIANAIAPTAQASETALIINDDVELAVEVGADGVHLGRSDMPIKTARKLLPEDMIIGATCHDSRHLAMQAGEDGADYVAFGAFFPTSTKDASTKASPALLRWWQDLVEIPCVAIGGITVENAGELCEAGADFLAVSAGVWQHTDGPVAAVKAFDKLLCASARASPASN